MIVLFENLFNSRSRTAVLFCLAELRAPLCLNELAELTNSSLTATLSAVKTLVRERLVRKKSVRNETQYFLNAKHPAVGTLKLLSKTLTHASIKQRAEKLQTRPKQVLHFVSTANSFISNVRAINNDTRAKT